MATDPPPAEPTKGLPPVQAPSGRHIVQLFLVPGLIVAGAVTILLGFSWLAGGSRTPNQFVKNIDSANPDIRWRAANDLAQVLKRDDKLAADPAFGLQLTERYTRALDEMDRLEKARAELPASAGDKDVSSATKTLNDQRAYVQYLGACLGSLSVPVGAPALIDTAKNGRGSDPMFRTLVRRQAVWALANLGDSMKRYQKLSESQKAEVVRKLEEEAASDNPTTRNWAQAALAWVKDRRSLGVIAALAVCAGDDHDVFLREQAAHALGFWEGDADEQRLAEQALLTLARDTGRGERIDPEEEK
ncbi:MAG: HEAT repeat domain-containing protein [Gemmataceae bacterium]